MHLPICPSRVLNTYSSARLRSVSTRSLCYCPAVQSQDPAYSLPSLQTDMTALYMEVAYFMMPSDLEYKQSGLCPVQPVGGCSMRTMLMLHCRALLTAHCLLSTSTNAPLRSFDSACSTYAAPLPCKIEAPSHVAPASVPCCCAGRQDKDWGHPLMPPVLRLTC